MTYQHALKLFLCFGSSCHGVVIGHALHPVPIASLLHIYIILMVALVSGLVRNRLAYDLPTQMNGLESTVKFSPPHPGRSFP